MENIKWIFNRYVITNFRIVYKQLFKRDIKFKKYAKRNILSIEEGSEYIFSKIVNGEPLMVCRYGAFELKTITEAYFINNKLSNKFGKNTLRYICDNAGFFPRDENKLLCFSNLMTEYSNNADLIGVWFNSMEDCVINKYSKQAQLTYLRALEPWYSNNPWTRALEGKNVLIIHPFEETIKKQYMNRDKLFDKGNILPEFNLITLKSVQTSGGEQDKRFKDWFEALDYMYKETLKIDFDIAIIGCGSYGFPLAAKIKESGKQAIHLGGATQLLFGIKGRRWDNHDIISKLYNDYWVRPLEIERPKSANIIEDGCYW